MRCRIAYFTSIVGLALGLLMLSHGGQVAPAAEDKAPTGFARDGVPFLQKHCYSCHGAEKQKADLALHKFKDDTAVLKDRRTWQNVLNMLQAGEMPPSTRPRPNAAEIDKFIKAVNDVYVRAAKNPDPGRVTIRRLNRAEYNNTIRDLVGVDFQPAEDFPSDDVGHGFDNIGDVLSLSPILLERYLAAAENIMQRAIVVDPPKPPVRHMSARYLEPAGPNVPQTRFRPVSEKGPRGMLNTPYSLSMDGEYIFKVKAYGTPPGKDKVPVKIALQMDGKELKTFDVTATEKSPAVYEAKVQLEPGNHRGAVVLLNPLDPKEGQRTLHVEYLELMGPLDTRPASQRRLLARKPGLSDQEATREALARFATQAYRRPATADEVERLARLADQTMTVSEKWEAGVQLAMQAVLVSPKFLFRVELDDRPQTKEPHAIDEFQLASRLSYFLWSTKPDETLFDLASKKQLTANLDAQVRRMLLDPRSKALVDNFAMQWLQLRNLRNIQPDAKLFPEFDEPLRQAMLKETELFIEAVFREDRSILDLIDADFTFLNERLARHYGLQAALGRQVGGGRGRSSEFFRVPLKDTQRGGILTQASVLTVTSNPTRTSPVKRGRWVLDQILGTPPPPPPPDVPELVEGDKAVLTGSLRQRMEQHRSNPSCANCHARMDPIGFAFENFNAIGAFRAKDGDFAIDPAGTLPDGKTFQGPEDLKTILKGKKELFSRCLAEKMLTYALGRGLEYYDQPTLDRINAALDRDGYKFSTLVTEIVKSDPFRMRRGKDSP